MARCGGINPRRGPSSRRIISGGSLPAYVIRLVSLWPLSLMAVNATANYKDVRVLDVFDAVPDGETFLEGLKIMGQVVRGFGFLET